MNVIEKRDYIHNHLHQLDEGLISLVYERIHSLIDAENPIIGYKPTGEPITKSELLTKVKKAKASIDTGNFISHDDLKKESENW